MKRPEAMYRIRRVEAAHGGEPIRGILRRELQAGAPLTEVAERWDISLGTLYRWLRENGFKQRWLEGEEVLR